MRNDLPNDKAPNFSARMRETVMTYLGKQGDPLDRGITLRDLVQSGFVALSGGKIGSGPVPLLPGDAIAQDTYVPDLTPPPAPTGFSVTAGIATVFVEHDKPTYTQGHGHLRTHVYGVIMSPGDPLPTFDDAAEITQFSGQVFAYSTNPSTTWRLWIKWETIDGVLGQPAGGTNGLAVTTGQDVSLLLEALTGELTEAQLYSTLGARINLIDVGPNALTTRMSSAESSITSIQSVNATQATQITNLTTSVGNNTTAIQTEATTRANVDTGLLAQYTVKADVNGYVSGFGLASTANNAAPTSTFAVRADSFYIANPAGPGVAPAMPFIVRTTATTIGGVSVPVGVYITDAFIQNGTISNAKIANAAIDDAKIANLSASKITAGTIDADRLDANTITSKVLSVDWAKITNASITSAQIANGAITTAKIGDAQITTAKIADTIQSTNYSSTAGWRINKAGAATFNEVALRGAINGGAYTGYAWPATGTGFHLSSSGLLLGNFNTGKYFRVEANGNVYAPQFSIVDGSAAFTGTVSAGNVIGALMRAVTVPSSYSGIAYETSSGAVTSSTVTPWSLNGSIASYFLVWAGTMPAPEGSVAHKIAATATVTARNDRGSSSGDLIVKIVRVDSYSGFSATGEVLAEATTSSPFNFSLSISGASSVTHTTSQTIAIFVTGFNSSNTVTTYSGLFWGVR